MLLLVKTRRLVMRVLLLDLSFFRSRLRLLILTSYGIWYGGDAHICTVESVYAAQIPYLFSHRSLVVVFGFVFGLWYVDVAHICYLKGAYMRSIIAYSSRFLAGVCTVILLQLIHSFTKLFVI